MLVAIFGQMGLGKTLMMTILANYLVEKLPQIPFFANYEVQKAKAIRGVKHLLTIEDGLICLDEFWVSMDSRAWKNNVFLTRWINQTRKKNLLCMYTTQSFGQIDVRVRNATDLLIFCERFKGAQPFFRYSFISGNNRTILKSFTIPEAKARHFYSYYDSFQLIRPLIAKFRRNYARKY